jgi:hypothetical protein
VSPRRPEILQVPDDTTSPGTTRPPSTIALPALAGFRPLPAGSSAPRPSPVRVGDLLVPHCTQYSSEDPTQTIPSDWKHIYSQKTMVHYSAFVLE